MNDLPETGKPTRTGWWWGAPLLAGLLWFTLINHLRVEWSINPQYSFGWGVPWLALYLFWKRWPVRPAPSPNASARLTFFLALPFLLLLLPVRLLLEANPDWRFVSWILGLSVVCLTLLLLLHAGGPAWPRHFAMPVALILFAIPWPSSIEQPLIQNLMRSVAGVTVDCANWIGVPARQHGNLIEMPAATVGVDEACSGVRSFQSTLMAAVFLGELYRFSLRRRIALVLGGLALALALNVCRTFVLTLAMYRRGEAGLNAIHDPAGYIVLAVAFAMLWLLCSALDRRATGPPPRDSTPVTMSAARAIPTRPLALAATWLVLAEIANETWYRAHERSAGKSVAWSIDWPPPGDGFNIQTIEENVRVVLRFDEGRSGLFLNDDGSQALVYFFRWNPGRSAAQSARIHTPDLCLPASGLVPATAPGTWTLVQDALRLTFRTYVYDGGGRRWHVFYLLWEDRPTPASLAPEDLSRSSRIRAMLEGRRHLGQQVLEIAITGATDVGVAKRQVERYLRRWLKLAPPENR